MRWLVIGLLASVSALLLVAGGVAMHVRRQRRILAKESADVQTQNARHLELDLALELPAKPVSGDDSGQRRAK